MSRRIVATAELESVSPYSQSRHYKVEKLSKEGPDDYEKRTWRERMHVDDKGMIFIPPMAFKNCLSEAAKYLGMQIAGKGKSTYTKHFEAGLLVFEPVPLGIHKDKVEGEWLFVPADGRRGSGKRVERCFPLIRSWKGKVTFQIFDPTITQDVFRQHLEEAGKFIGIGRFRPRNNGFYGRFEVKSLKWEEMA
jgi:hypothetical protein